MQGAQLQQKPRQALLWHEVVNGSYWVFPLESGPENTHDYGDIARIFGEGVDRWIDNEGGVSVFCEEAWGQYAFVPCDHLRRSQVVFPEVKREPSPDPAELATSAPSKASIYLGTERIDALPPEHQVPFYREGLMQMKYLLQQALPIVQAHDNAHRMGYDDYHLSIDIRQALDLRKSLSRSLNVPTRDVDLIGLPIGLTSVEAWNKCIDVMIELNREYGITTKSHELLPGAVRRIVQFGKDAFDPLEAPEISQKTRGYRLLAKLFGEDGIKKFVNENSDYHRPWWLRCDVQDMDQK